MIAKPLTVIAVCAVVIGVIWTLMFWSWWQWIPIGAAIGISVVVARLIKE